MAKRGAQQPTLVDDTPARLPTVICQDCKRPLRDPVSRLRRMGPECDPDRRTGHREHHVEQDPIPGT